MDNERLHVHTYLCMNNGTIQLKNIRETQRHRKHWTQDTERRQTSKTTRKKHKQMTNRDPTNSLFSVMKCFNFFYQYSLK